MYWYVTSDWSGPLVAPILNSDGNLTLDQPKKVDHARRKTISNGNPSEKGDLSCDQAFFFI